MNTNLEAIWKKTGYITDVCKYRPVATSQLICQLTVNIALSSKQPKLGLIFMKICLPVTVLQYLRGTSKFKYHCKKYSTFNVIQFIILVIKIYFVCEFSEFNT